MPISQARMPFMRLPSGDLRSGENGGSTLPFPDGRARRRLGAAGRRDGRREAAPPGQAARVPFCLATWVAIASISGGDRQS
jgi:hypothetical protein